MKRKPVLLIAAGVVLLALAIVTIVLVRARVRRHRVFRPAAGETRPKPPEAVPPVEQWTATFQELSGSELQDLLEAIEAKHPDLYAKYSLAYLHARVLADNNETSEAAAKLAPFLEKGNPYRELALYHRASIADDEEASRYRLALITEHPQSPYRDEAIDEEIVWLAERDEPQPLVDFAAAIAPSASTERRREMSARIVEALVDRDANAALTRGMALLNGGTGDDAADRVVRALDKPALIARLTTDQRALMGEAFQKHRHYDRAVALLGLALQAAHTDDLQFALGRSYFGAERYAEAQAAYLRGANATKVPAEKCQFLWHAARSAQLNGDDRTAEQLMTAAIAVKGRFPATTVALTQRMRTRLQQKRLGEAAADLALLKRLAPNERSLLEGSLAYAVGHLAAGNGSAAVSALSSVPATLLNDYDEAEFAYWRARATESANDYLKVLRSPAPSHFDSFARARLAAMKIDQELRVREVQVANLIAKKQWDLARRVQTDRVLLRPDDAQLKTLASIYRELPQYRAVLELQPHALPRFPLDGSDRDSLLMAMGLADEAVSAIEKRWALRPAREALTRSLALNQAGASRESIYAIEVMMKSVPDDFHPALLPDIVKQLLYPRYFHAFVAEDAKRYEADPSLVLAIMREESRFNPRAKSAAAARGLLQFIITTARDIGLEVGLVDVDPEDLYDPRVIIRLGAKYIAELAGQFGGNRYRTAAAYNAGPKQVALWTRMQPSAGDDYFLTAVNFDETKHYVRKVLNSYEMYEAIY